MVGWFWLTIICVVVSAAAPSLVRLIVDAWARTSVASHDRRTQYVLARMRLIDLECDREMDRGAQERGRRC